MMERIPLESYYLAMTIIIEIRVDGIDLLKFYNISYSIVFSVVEVN